MTTNEAITALSELSQLIGKSQGHLLHEAWGHKREPMPSVASERYEELSRACEIATDITRELIEMKRDAKPLEE